MPTVLLPAADPWADPTVAAPPAATVHPEYVYLLRVVLLVPQGSKPNAKIPIVLVPAADPAYEATVAAPPAATTHPEYVYLLRVVTGVLGAFPKAKIPTVLLPAAEP